MAGNNGGPQQPGGIREVARLAGVSVASASFALNGQPGVAEHTRQRILAAADPSLRRKMAEFQASLTAQARAKGAALRSMR